MKVLFIADFFRRQHLGGGESNDKNLIDYLNSKGVKVVEKNSNLVIPSDILKYKKIIVGNFVLLSAECKEALIRQKNYIIYEHDHKYLATRDPSKFFNFQIAPEHVINKAFYENAQCVVVLSKVCAEILKSCIPRAVIHNIGCSLWSSDTLSFLKESGKCEKVHDYGILKSSNATKNYIKTKQLCTARGIAPFEMNSSDYYEFLSLLGSCETFIFVPTVLETFSRVCAEAKMLNTQVQTIKKLIGFYSEDYSSLQGEALIDKINEKNNQAYEFFWSLVK